MTSFGAVGQQGEGGNCKGRLKTNEKEKRRCVRQQRENERQGRGESMDSKFKD